MKYDLAIVGAGPGGLMAAGTAASVGLKVVVIERKREITEINRLCGQFANINMISVGGKHKYAYSEPVSLEVGTKKTLVNFPGPGFSIEYNGPIRPYFNYIHFSPSGKTVFREKDRFFGFFWEKEALLTGLLSTARKAGAEIITGVAALGAENTRTGVSIVVQDGGTTRTIGAARAIAADGKGSRVANSLGVNEGRPIHGATTRGIGYVLEGVRTEFRNGNWLCFTVPSLAPVGNLWMFQVTGDRNIIGTTARAGESPGEATELFMKLPYFASWFRKARIIKKLAFGSSGYHLPLQDPVVGKVLILGEAAGVNETSNPGAIACGYQAAKATVNEMNGKNGYRDYTTWWQKSFEGNDPDYYKAAGRFFSINALCSDVEVDYLYGLIEGQIGVPAVLIARNLERMKGDQPELYEKLKKTGMDKGVSDIKLDWGTVIAKPGKPKA